MFVRDLWAGLVRRWPLTLLMIVVTAGLVVLALRVVPPTYETTTEVLLVPPTDVNNPNANRFLNLGSLSQARDVLVRRLSSDSVRDQVLEGDDGGYEAVADFSTGAPIVELTVVAPSPQRAREVEDALASMVPRTLSGLQAEVAIQPEARITSITLREGEDPEAVGKQRIRAAIAAGGVGLVGGLFAIGLADGMLLRRGSPRGGGAPPRTHRHGGKP